MRIKFNIAELSNIFFIMDSVSDWSIHSRPKIKKLYECQFGLGPKGKEILKEYVKLRKKYGWSKLDSIFYLAGSLKEAFKTARKEMTPQEFIVLKRTIDHFYKTAKIMYEDHKRKLWLRKKSLEKEIQKKEISKILDEISKFYESEKRLKKVTCHLNINTSDGNHGGGANIEPKEHITLEPYMLGMEKADFLLTDIRIMIHEILHLIEGRETIKEIKRKMPHQDKIDTDIIREAIADSLMPVGVLAVKYKLTDKSKILQHKKIGLVSKKKDKRKYDKTMRQRLSVEIYRLTENQIKKGKTFFDGEYLNKVIKKFHELKKESEK